MPDADNQFSAAEQREEDVEKRTDASGREESGVPQSGGPQATQGDDEQRREPKPIEGRQEGQGAGSLDPEEEEDAQGGMRASAAAGGASAPESPGMGSAPIEEGNPVREEERDGDHEEGSSRS